MSANLNESSKGLEKALISYGEMMAKKELFLDEKVGLTERERRFAMYVISKAVGELREYQKRKETNGFEDVETKFDRPGELERGIGIGIGQRNAATNIAGSSLSELFGGMGMDTILALEALARRENIHTYCPIIVEEYYGELVKQWKR